MKMTKKANKSRITSALCVLCSVLLLSCSSDEGFEQEGLPDTPTEGRHLRLSGSVGNDNTATRASWTDNDDRKLTFAWDYSNLAATESEMKMAFTKKDGSYLETIEGNPVTDARILRHTDAEKQEDAHFAVFETIGTYYDVFDGYTVHAVTPVNKANSSTAKVIIDDEEKGTFTATLQMPTEFTQFGENSLAHLSNYTYMYAQGTLSNSTASLAFAHLAAYVRFKVYNWRGESATIYGVKLEVVDAEGKAVPAAGVQATYNDVNATFGYTPASETAGIRVNITDGSSIIDTGSIFLYAPVFPAGTAEPFKDKYLRFTIIAKDPTGILPYGEYKYFTYELDGNTFETKTGSYDWIPGDLYTFHLYLDDLVRVPEVTVNDWVTADDDLEGGVAEEYSNETTE